MTRRALGVALTLLVVAPAGALAQVPAPPPPPGPPAPAGAPVVAVSLEGVLRDRRRAVVLARDSFRARGSVTPFVPGQTVVVRLSRGSRRLAARRVAVRQVGTSARGTFAATFRAPRSGRLAVRAVHAATPQQPTGRSRAASVQVLRARTSLGSRGPVVRLLQAGLDRLRFAVPRSGVYDAGTSRAVMAYRKVNGMARTGSASEQVISRVLRGRGAFRPRFPKGGHHVEGDLSRQVLALVEGSRVVRVYHTSSGAPATPTVTGSFSVYLKTPGVNAKGMVHSSYFIRGYAVHGYPSVPAYNASHGCLRVPIANARSIFDWMRMGTRVFVYR